LLRPGGIVTVIFRADGEAHLLDTLGGDFGGFAVLPVLGKPGMTAIRVIVGAVKGSDAPLTILPELVLAEDDGTPSKAAEAALRHGAAIKLCAS
jgi:tRNA1(Val) A37 N6-methylase TrmN6